MDNRLQHNAYEYLSNIIEVNDFIKLAVNYISDDEYGLLKNLINNNFKAYNIFKQINEDPSQLNLDIFLSFWVYEFANSIDGKRNLPSTLFTKYNSLFNYTGSNPVNNNYLDFEAFENILTKNKLIIEKYSLKPESVVIITAVPIEFISILRKVSQIILVSDKDEVQRILDPTINLDDKKERKTIWVSAVFQRKNKWVKVRIILLNEYGSVSSGISISNIQKHYVFKNEVLLVGIAGQLDVSNDVKIGHLLISDGFYNGYSQKNNSNGISYEDLVLKPTSNDYNVSDFNYNNWKPLFLNISAPTVENMDRECNSNKVHIGKFVSIPGVNKSGYSKKLLMEKFKDSKGVEMEASGCFQFIRDCQPHLHFKIIKSICDWSDESKEKRWQPYCADLASEFTVDYLIAKYGKEIETK
jgi:hypothetical protein